MDDQFLWKAVAIRLNNGFYETVGLDAVIHRELKVVIKQSTDAQYISLLKYLIDYILDSKPLINPNQTIAYHSWILKFVDASENYYSMWEAKADGANYAEGAEYAIKMVTEQIEECDKLGVKPIFPTFSQNVVISKGVYEGLAIEAVRYPSPNHMAGWWLTTALFGDNVETLMNVHYYHVAFTRPDIMKYLALPYGYRFFADSNTNSVWFDKEALN